MIDNNENFPETVALNYIYNNLVIIEKYIFWDDDLKYKSSFVICLLYHVK